MKRIEFTTSLLTFYLKGSIEGNEHFINFTIPNTFLGVIPLGSRNHNLATNQIALTTTNFRLEFKTLLLGLFLFFVGISSFLDSFLGALILLAIGACLIVSAFACELDVTTTSGQAMQIYFLIFEREKAVQASQEINALIANRIDDTNVRYHTDKVIDNANNNTDRIVDAINNKE